MNLSNRINVMQFSTIRKLAPFADEAKLRGVSVYHLNIGQPDINTPDTFMEGMKHYTDKVLKYVDSRGTDPLIESFIKYYKEWDIEFTKDEIMITNGGSEAIMFSLMAICDPGDEIIVPEPFYTNYNGLADISSVKIVPFITKAEDGFHLPSKEEITSKITSKTKAIMVSNPGNPTGVVYTEAEIRMLADIACENDIFLIADEVYREFVYDGLKYTSALYMTDALDNIILIDSISKRYSACGARIGLVASKNKILMSEMLKLGQTRLCVPAIEQAAAANLINTPKSYFEEVKNEYQERRDILHKYLTAIPGVVCQKPTGAFYVVAKLPIDNCEDFAKWLLTDFEYNKKTIMVAPAEGFYGTCGLGIDEIRLSYCLNKESLKDAMEILGIAIEKYISIKK